MRACHGQHEVSGLKERLFRLSGFAGPEGAQEVVLSVVGEIQNSESIDLHYTGHAKEQTIGDSHLRLLIAAMQEVDLSGLQVSYSLCAHMDIRNWGIGFA